MRRLIIDGQVFQTPALFRGMGKYSIELISALRDGYLGQRWDSIDILVSKNMETDRQEIEKAFGDANIVSLDLKANQIGDRDIADYNKSVVSNYISSFGAESRMDYLILSLMQGEIHPVFPTSDKVNKMVLFYDLIPLMFHKTYLQNPITREEYLFKLRELLSADLYLAISQTVANDLSQYLGVDSSRVISIDGGPIVHGKETEVYETSRPFVLMPTGNDLRKNNQRGIIAFEEFNRSHSHNYDLLITSFFKEHEISELQTLAKNVVFTGNISGEQMQYLYANCEALLFPSEYEGLGLPILEAVEFNKPIACSDISVFREMSVEDFDVFDAKDIGSIALALEAALFCRKINKSNYQKILKKYTWERTASLLVAGLDGIKKKEIEKIDLTLVAPDPARNEPLMRHNLMLHAELVRNFNMSYCHVHSKVKQEMRVNFLPYVSPSVSLGDVPLVTNIYVIDDFESYVDVLLAALAVPGVTLLFSDTLEKLWASAVQRQLISDSRIKLEERIQKIYGDKNEGMLVSLIISQIHIIVFSESAKKIVDSIIDKSGANTTCSLLKLPINTRKYPEILPAKTKDTTNPEAQTDFEYFEQLEHSRTVSCSSFGYAQGSKNVVSLEALAAGVYPILDSKDSYFAPKITKVINGTYDSSDTDQMIRIAERQSYNSFSNNLHKIISSLAERD